VPATAGILTRFVISQSSGQISFAVEYIVTQTQKTSRLDLEPNRDPLFNCLLHPVTTLLVVENPPDDFTYPNVVKKISLPCHRSRATPAYAFAFPQHDLEPFLPEDKILGA
jgi:hypothetical protein